MILNIRRDGDGKIDGNDQVAIGATTKPNLIYGFGIAANWKGLDVNLHFQGAGKSTYFIDGSTVHMFKLGDGWGNVLSEMANSNRWISADISASERNVWISRMHRGSVRRSFKQGIKIVNSGSKLDNCFIYSPYFSCSMSKNYHIQSEKVKQRNKEA